MGIKTHGVEMAFKRKTIYNVKIRLWFQKERRGDKQTSWRCKEPDTCLSGKRVNSSPFLWRLTKISTALYSLYDIGLFTDTSISKFMLAPSQSPLTPHNLHVMYTLSSYS